MLVAKITAKHILVIQTNLQMDLISSLYVIFLLSSFQNVIAMILS